VAEWTQAPQVDADQVVLEVSEDLRTWAAVRSDAADVVWSSETLPDWRVRHRVLLSGLSPDSASFYARLGLRGE
jgi:hypothetical protein